jgi:hypothetical protein
VPNKKALFIYDVNNEYGEFFPHKLLSVEEFMERAQFISKGVFVLEEATIYLNNRSTNPILIDLLTRKRHTFNTIIMVFHSMRAVPRYVYELSNHIVIFKTNDSPDMTSRELKDHRLEEIMIRVRASKNLHYYETLKIY